MGTPHYVLLDGDGVGPRIEDLLFRNALPRLYFMLQDLNEALLLLAHVFRRSGGQVYVCGGDTVLGSVDNVRSLLLRLDSVRRVLPCTFSAGVGSSVGDALIALKLAKARGPGEVVRVRRVRGTWRSSHWGGSGGWQEDPSGRRRRSSKSHRNRPVLSPSG